MFAIVPLAGRPIIAATVGHGGLVDGAHLVLMATFKTPRARHFQVTLPWIDRMAIGPTNLWMCLATGGRLQVLRSDALMPS